MHDVGRLLSSFGSLSLSVLPWLAVGIAAAAIIQTFVSQRWAARALGGHTELPLAIAVGALMPGCSRTTTPIVIGLRGIRGPKLGSLTALLFVAAQPDHCRADVVRARVANDRRARRRGARR
jgi:uncharacterized membrane protein YraQ (UPF0718 family)